MVEFTRDERFSQSAPTVRAADPARDRNNNVNHDVCAAMLKELSAPQTEAAMATDQTILLIAPAGTGKTKTMTARIAHMMATGVAPTRILACTYTNAAANELKDRLAPALRIPIEDLWLGTIHSIGLRIIRAHAKDLGLHKADSIVDEEQASQIVYRILRDMGHPSVDTPDEIVVARRALEFIGEAKSRMVAPKDAAELHANRDLHWAAGVSDDEIRIYKAYMDFLTMYDMIDYADMLYLPTRLLENDRRIGDLWKAKFDSVLVDEYQDLALSQIRLLRNLIDRSRTTLFAAADDDQCIYGWRGSDLSNTVEFARHWAGARIMQLTDNYRTPKTIFDHASKLIGHVSSRYEKSIATMQNPNAIVRVIEAPDAATEKERVLEAMVDGMRSFDVTPERVAVLCRSNRMCAQMATFLASSGIDVNLHEGLPLNTQPVSALVAWMQLATTADNPIMFDRMTRYPNRMISEGQIRDVEQRVQRRNETAENRIGPIAYMMDMDKRGKLPAGTGAKAFADNVRIVRNMLMPEDPKDAVSSPFAKVGELLGIAAAARASERSEDHAYGRFVQLLDEMVDQIGLEKTLSSLTSIDFNSGRKGVNVTTMHGAKGLEFDIVFAPGWEEGEFPNYKRQGDDQMDEERRVAYVTITRARLMLVVSWAMNRKKATRPSRFIREMGAASDEPQVDAA